MGTGELADTVAKIIVESESGLIKEYQVNLDYTGQLNVQINADKAISSGFNLYFDPALPGLNASDIELWDTDSDQEIPVIAVSSTDNGNTFFVTASLSENTNYMVKSANNCYNFDQNPVFNYQKTAVNSLNEKGFKLYPNPASDIITIIQDGKGKAHLKISDLGGRLTEIYELYEPEVQIDISDLSKGVYFFDLINEEGRTVRMVVVEK